MKEQSTSSIAEHCINCKRSRMICNEEKNSLLEDSSIFLCDMIKFLLSVEYNECEKKKKGKHYSRSV